MILVYAPSSSSLATEPAGNMVIISWYYLKYHAHTMVTLQYTGIYQSTIWHYNCTSRVFFFLFVCFAVILQNIMEISSAYLQQNHNSVQHHNCTIVMWCYNSSSFKFHAKAMAILYYSGTYQSALVLPSVTVWPRHQCWSKESATIHITVCPSNKAHKHKYCLIAVQQRAKDWSHWPS